MNHPDRLALAFETDALALPEGGRVVVLNAEPSAFLDMVPRERLHCVQTFRPVHDALASAGRSVSTSADGPAGTVVVCLTRSRVETLGAIAAALDLLVPGGLLVVTGAKTDGVDSIARSVASALPVDGAYSKAHGRVFWLTRPADLPPAVSEWAAAAAPARNSDGFLTAPGMFSADHPDPGSRRLAATFAGLLKGRVADLGAGWGWLAGEALAACPAITALDLHEADARALDAARVNVTDARATFHWSDVATLGKAAGPCNWVISNPPFHHGRAAEPELGAGFLRAAARMLRPDGRLLVVANRQLPYEATLATAFRRTESLAEDGAFKVILAAQPRRA